VSSAVLLLLLLLLLLPASARLTHQCTCKATKSNTTGAWQARKQSKQLV
jgi:hypothetical protein